MERYEFKYNGLFPDDYGEWVRWEDMKHLIPFHEAVMSYMKERTEEVAKGTSKLMPRGIL